jgi:hypothetical protein
VVYFRRIGPPMSSKLWINIQQHSLNGTNGERKSTDISLPIFLGQQSMRLPPMNFLYVSLTGTVPRVQRAKRGARRESMVDIHDNCKCLWVSSPCFRPAVTIPGRTCHSRLLSERLSFNQGFFPVRRQHSRHIAIVTNAMSWL